MSYLKLDKKGNLFLNIAIVVVGLFSIIVGAIITRLIYEEIMAVLKVVPEFQSVNHDKAFAGFDFAVSSIDGLIFFVALMFIIGVIVASLRVPENSVFYIVLFIVAPFLGIFSYFFSYITQTIIGNSAFNTVILYFPLSSLIGLNLHWLCLIMIIIGGIAKYYKSKKNQTGEVLI
jgi:hypothetical protein